jgi:hypothetical protein|tara:strand:- start:650 stop:844 length:195 start_codon:yes stop_codon:yes gene_type:complete
VTNLYWVWAFISAFWTTVVVQCAKPVNMERCLQVDDWLVPWARDVMEMRREGAYASEKKKLEER